MGRVFPGLGEFRSEDRVRPAAPPESADPCFAERSQGDEFERGAPLPARGVD